MLGKEAFRLALLLSLGLLVGADLRADQWPTLGGDSLHSGHAARGLADFSRPRGPYGSADDLLNGSSPAVCGDVVVVLGELFDGPIPINETVNAYNRHTGAPLWSTPIDYPVFVNNSPTIDVKHSTVLVAADRTLYCLDLADGAERWSTPLLRTTNATVTVAGDLAFLTDYHGFGTDASLYAVNLDPDHPDFDEGEIVWRRTIGGASGATPAVADGRVYVGSTEGRMHALDALTGDPLWTEPMPTLGWQNGWALETPLVHNGFLYAATYNFSTISGEYNSHLVKLDADTGQRLWDIASERSFATPVVAGDRVYLLGGIQGAFGSVPKLMCFRDLGNSAELLWDTPLVGGTTFHLVHAAGRLYAGRAQPFPDDFIYDRLYIFDIARTPDDPGFVLDVFDGAGASPALVDGSLYTIGPGGLFVFDAAPRRPGDTDGDGDVDLIDFATFSVCFAACDPNSAPPGCSPDAFAAADMNGDGCINLTDFSSFSVVLGTASE